jgi:hypothetical protein
MKRFLIALFFLLASSPLAHAQADPTSRSWNRPVEPYRIAGNVYYVGASDITSFLITTSAGHILLDIFGNFVVQGFNAGGKGIGISILCFLFVAFINTLEMLVAAIQAYVFAILTALYINDAVNLH